MEFIDIISPENEVLSSASRDEVHRNHSLHRAVQVLIRTSKGRYLLQQRSPDKDHYPLWWHAAVAGHVNAGSTPHQSACREMKEEIGISTTLEYLDAFIVDDTDEYEMVFVYFGCHDGPFYPDKSEIAQLDFIHECDLSDITRRYRLTPHAARAFELVKK